MTNADLIDLFTAALRCGAVVTISQEHAANARGVLVAWAAAMDLAVTERRIGRIAGGHNVRYGVDHGRCSISVVVRETDAAIVGGAT